MNKTYSDTENVVDLMVKAALVDGVETTIRRGHYFGTIEVVMKKDDGRCSHLVDLNCAKVPPSHAVPNYEGQPEKALVWSV